MLEINSGVTWLLADGQTGWSTELFTAVDVDRRVGENVPLWSTCWRERSTVIDVARRVGENIPLWSTWQDVLERTFHCDRRGKTCWRDLSTLLYIWMYRLCVRRCKYRRVNRSISVVSDGPTTGSRQSRKPVFEKIAKTQRSYFPLCGHTTFVQPTPALTVNIIDEITIKQNHWR